MYLSLSLDSHSSYQPWFFSCAAVLTFTGTMQLIAISLYAFQVKKAAYLWAGLGSQWVNCLAPVPLLLLLVFGVQLQGGSQAERHWALGVMVLMACVLLLNVLCEWKKACLVCISCCGVCATQTEPRTQELP